MRVILGGAQLGMKYGQTNITKFSKTNSLELLETALSLGIDTVDLASNYGNSHEIIKEFGAEKLKIHTKIPSLNNASSINNPDDLLDKLKHEIDKIFKETKAECIDTLYFHDQADIALLEDDDFKKVLMDYKDEGLIESFGVSVYDKIKLDEIFDSVQIPLNYVSGDSLLQYYKNVGSVYCRSTFLQGVLVNHQGLDKNFIKRYGLKAWHNFMQKRGVNPIELCLSYANDACSGLILGFDNSSQLLETYGIISSLDKHRYDDVLRSQYWIKYLKNIDELKDPRKWK